MPGEHLLESRAGSPSVLNPSVWWLQRPLHRLALAWHRRKLKLKKPQRIKTQQLLLVQSGPSPFLCVFLCLFLAVWFWFLLSLLFMAMLLIWQQLVLSGWGAPSPPSLPPHRAPHLGFRCGISPALPAGPGLRDAAAPCPAPELASAVGRWAKGLHLSSSQFKNLNQSWLGSFTK